MTTRKLEITKFRNLGITKATTLELNANVDEGQGDLVILIGENNIGKSNVIAALQAFGNQSMTDSDKPNFIDCEDDKPSLKLIQTMLQNSNTPRKSVSTLLDTANKVFNITFTDGSLEKATEDAKYSEDDYVVYLQNSFDKTKEILALHDLDDGAEHERESREEIRIILDDVMLLCSTRIGKDLKCFRVLKRPNDIKNIQRAIKLECKFSIKSADTKDDANELKKILKDDFKKYQKSSEPQSKADFMETQDCVELRYSEESKKFIDKGNTIKQIMDKFIEFDEFFGDCEDNNKESFDKLKEKLNQFEYDDKIDDDKFLKSAKSFYDKLQTIYFSDISWKQNYYGKDYDLNENITILQEKFNHYDFVLDDEKNKYFSTFNRLRREWYRYRQELERVDKDLDSTKIKRLGEIYNRLKNIFLPDFSPSYTNIQNVETVGNIELIPQVIYYNEVRLKDSDLTSTPESFEQSKFFQSLCVILGDKVATQIGECYAKNKVDSYRQTLEQKLNKIINKIIDKKFNEMLGGDNNYSFSLRLENNRIVFSFQKKNTRRRNDEKQPLMLSQQSTGFQWFFNFYFNFLHSHNIKSGDIVLLDELGGTLSIPTQRDLRAFLKDFAKRSNITFVVATHTPYLIDINHLDELRIIEQSKEGNGAEIINDFAILDDNDIDALYKIKKALGTDNYFSMVDGDSKIMFVEGITDYNYLTKFKLLYEIEKEEKLNIAFLPIGGLGAKESKREETIIKELPKIARTNKSSHAILLVDGDKAGESIESKAKAHKTLSVLKLKDIAKNVKEIEDLFSAKDRENILPIKKSAMMSKSFKNSDCEIDERTKDNFYNLLKELEKFTEMSE